MPRIHITERSRRGGTEMGALLAQPSRIEENVAKLEAHVQARLSGRVRDLRLVCRDRGLVIQGWAATYHAKQVAQHVVMEAAPFAVIANEIEVAGVGG